MSKSMPFVCKWLGTHSDPQHFETKEKLRNHIVQHDINSCDKSTPGNPTYICPWIGCKGHNKYQRSIIELEEHLRQHIKQRPFKCPICNRSRFGSSYALSQHLIINHNGSVADPDTDDDTLYDKNKKLNLGKAEDKNDVYVKKEVNKNEKDEIMPISNTAN